MESKLRSTLSNQMTQVLKEECPLNKKMMLHRLLLLLDLDIGKENVVE